MTIERIKSSLRLVKLLAMLALCAARIDAQTPTTLWSVDLGADKDFQKRLTIQEVLLGPPFVSFLNESQIICSFYDREKVGFDPSIEQPIFHVLEIDVRTGAFGRKLDFQSVNDRSLAFPVADGGFVVLAGQELRKFSSSFVPGLTYPTPVGGTYRLPDYWLADVAPEGKEIILFNRHEHDMAFKWLRSDDLTLMRNLPTGINWRITGSNNAVTDFRNEQLAILSMGGTVLRTCKLCIFNFLTDDLLFIDTGRTYSIETIRSQKRASGKLDGGASDFARSFHASRFAFLSGHYNGSGFPIRRNFNSLTGKIIVLDWNTNKRVAEIDVNEPAGNPSAGLTQSALALSPDGDYLLVLLHHTMTCYRLPR